MKKLFAFIIAISLLIFPAFVIARAGGGEDFGGGGFDSGGSDFDSDWGDSGSDFSGGSTSGSGDPFSSVIGTIIIIIIIVIIIRRSKKGLNIPSSTNGGSVTSSSQNNDELKSSLAKLKEIDPMFDQQKFKTHVKKVFMAVQQGWTNRDQSICRPFMAEEVYQSHQMQIDNMKSQKIINVLKNIVVGSVDFARVDLEGEFHKMSVKIKAQMRDFKVKEDAPDKPISGEVNATEPFTEYWVFIRKSNLKTKVKDGIFDRKCPNCGAPIDVSVAGKCKYCNATVINGDYDWVLSEIIQSSEWKE